MAVLSPAELALVPLLDTWRPLSLTAASLCEPNESHPEAHPVSQGFPVPYVLDRRTTERRDRKKKIIFHLLFHFLKCLHELGPGQAEPGAGS